MMFYVKSDETHFLGTVDSPQRVINDVSGTLGLQTESHLVLRSPNTRKPQSIEMVTKNEGSDNHSERLWGVADKCWP